jgi:hypothetical protein
MGTGSRHRQSRPVLARSSGSQDSSTPVARPHCTSPGSPILSGWCACSKRNARQNMAGFAKGYGYHQRLDPGAICDVQDRTRASIAHYAGGSNKVFRLWMHLRAGPSSLIFNYQIRRVCVWICKISPGGSPPAAKGPKRSIIGSLIISEFQHS